MLHLHSKAIPSLLVVLMNPIFSVPIERYVSNIVFSNGLIDPWRGGGILKSPNDKIEIITIANAPHVFDLRASNPNDPESVRVARKTELKVIAKWLSDIGTDYY